MVVWFNIPSHIYLLSHFILFGVLHIFYGHLRHLAVLAENDIVGSLYTAVIGTLVGFEADAAVNCSFMPPNSSNHQYCGSPSIS